MDWGGFRGWDVCRWPLSLQKQQLRRVRWAEVRKVVGRAGRNYVASLAQYQVLKGERWRRKSLGAENLFEEST
jgi:hypothetical protein